MATIIDNTYFEKGWLFIPNNKDLNAEPTASPSAQSEIDFFIEEYERELLLNALGVTLYNELQAELPTPATQKWIDLVDGKDYTINSKRILRPSCDRGVSGLFGADRQNAQVVDNKKVT